MNSFSVDGSDSGLRDISDTALWVAIYRARETERPDALFRDPYARRLAGPRGEEIARKMDRKNQDWPFVARTVVMDDYVRTEVEQGTDLVINLAAGLDTRPYRMDLPAELQWIEVDLPGMIDYKEEMLQGEVPHCRLDRVRLDLADRDARRELFAAVGARASRVLIISEGLLVYLSRDEVADLATDLAAAVSFERWILDVASPGLLRMLQRQWSEKLEGADAPLKFAPEEGPAFFIPYGWQPIRVESSLKSAARIRRLPLILRLFALLPESTGRQGDRPWAGLCNLARVRAAAV